MRWQVCTALISDRPLGVQAKAATSSPPSDVDWVRGLLTRPAYMAPHITGRRLSRWLMALSVLQDGFDGPDMMRLQNSFAAQSRWLSRHWQKAEDGLARLTAVCGLALAGLAVNDDGRILRRGMDGLMRELRRQILPDGGHISRAPFVLIHLLADLIAIEGGLAARQITPRRNLPAIKRMQSMLALMHCRMAGAIFTAV